MILAPTQKKIFNTIFRKTDSRNIAILPTQYGKSFTIALAVLARASSIKQKEKWIVVAPNKAKAQIIMDEIITHCFDNEIFKSQLEMSGSLDQLKRSRKKSKITFKRGSEIMTLGLDSKNTKRGREAAMGFGAKNIILDESSLISNESYASVKRMLGEDKKNSGFLFEIGNPFYRNHFYRTWEAENNYNKIFADYRIALEEGRFTEEYIEEMREEALFDVYYECKFPKAEIMNNKGYILLINEKDINIVKDEKIVDNKKLGCDVAAGGDETVIVLRGSTKKGKHLAKVLFKGKTKDTMTVVNLIEKFIKEHRIDQGNVFIDDIGVGKGVSDRLKEKYPRVKGISVGMKPIEDKYINIKAENSFELRNALKNGLCLVEGGNWEQINWIRYKIQSDKKIKMEPKQDLIKEHGHSPDTFEALMLTFTQTKNQAAYFL